VQVNVPFREPLLPDGPLGPGETAAEHAAAFEVAEHAAEHAAATNLDVAATAADAGPGLPASRAFATVVRGRRILDDASLDALAARVAGARRGLIVAGPDADPALPAALAELARVTGFPIVADPLSGLRAGPHDRSRVVVRGDQLVRPGRWIDAHLPDLVLRTGAMPTSKPMLELLARVRPELVVLDGDAGWREAALVPATYVHADAAATARSLAAHDALRTPPAADAWTAGWMEADRAAGQSMADWLAALNEPFEGAPWPVLADALPGGGVLWASSSMPVRDLDAWLPSTGRAITVCANRGANGIDGVVSSALGSAAVAAGPVAVVVGDLAFLHDLNALVAARLHGLSATIVLVNNDGGGIFSFLPQARPGVPVPGSGLPEHYEELFGTPHGIDVGPIVASLGGEHRLVGDAAALGAAVRDSVGRPGVRVIELRTDRARNLELHRDLAAAVRRALDELVDPA
jgi:2-succinyl-5-enolpyruvyl-6-hydroxy-3-cyclohexene-1-carboxylate synthase